MGSTSKGALAAGQILEGYRLVRHIADGGMGTVFEAEDTRTRERVAIKALNPEFAKNPDILERFRKEAQAASAIGDEHIVRVRGMGRVPGASLFIAMELLEGQNLAERLVTLGGRMVFARAAKVMHQVLWALTSAHRQGIVHRDLKPENIFLVQRGDDADFVKVLDFGISKMVVDQAGMQLSSTGFVLGTPHYMAPEQARGLMLDHRVDIYACGAILYQMVTGRLPFTAPNFNALMFEIVGGNCPPPRTLVPELPPGFEHVIRQAMAVDPARRYLTAEALMHALVPFVAGTAAPRDPSVAAPGRAAVEPARHPRAQTASARRGLWVAAFVGLLLGAGGGIAHIRGSRSSAQEGSTPPRVVAFAPEAPSGAVPVPHRVVSTDDPLRRATLTFEISPAKVAKEARILVDGKDIKGDHVKLPIEADKEHTIEIKARGYSTYRRRLRVTEDTSIPVVLEKRTHDKKGKDNGSDGPGGLIDL